MVPRDMVQCPVCGGREVRGDKHRVGSDDAGRDRNEYEFFCRRCHTLEQRREDAADFREWKQRWTAADPARDPRDQ